MKRSLLLRTAMMSMLVCVLPRNPMTPPIPGSLVQTGFAPATSAPVPDSL